MRYDTPAVDIIEVENRFTRIFVVTRIYEDEVQFDFGNRVRYSDGPIGMSFVEDRWLHDVRVGEDEIYERRSTIQV